MWLHGTAPNTARAYRREAAAFSAFVGGAVLPAVTLGDVQAYADHLEARGLAPATRARALAAVKSLLTFAHRIGYLPVNVGAAERLPRLKFTLAERIVPREVVAALITGEPSPRNRALLRLLYFGGLRESEACGLRWRDVQARAGGGVQVTVYGKGAKTRVVLLPAAIAAELAELRGAAGADAPVFAGRGGALTASQVWRIVKAAGARAGVPALSPHWLRHAHASHALDGGAGIHVVRDTLGHASLATTSRYLHARPGDSSALYLAAV
jgi:integrase/recombinase XerD